MPLNEHAVRNVSLHMDVPRQLVKGEGVAVRRLPSEYQIATYQNLTRGEKEGFAELEERVWEGGVLVGGEEVEVRYRQAPSLMVTIGNVCAEGCYDKEEGKCLIGAAAEREKEKKEAEEKKGEEKKGEQVEAQEEAKEEKQEGETKEESQAEHYPDPETSDCSLCYHSREGPCKEFFLAALPDILASKHTRNMTLFSACISGYAYYDTSPASVGNMFEQYESSEEQQ